jgi:hypothetical protein
MLDIWGQDVQNHIKRIPQWIRMPFAVDWLDVNEDDSRSLPESSNIYILRLYEYNEAVCMECGLYSNLILQIVCRTNQFPFSTPVIGQGSSNVSVRTNHMVNWPYSCVECPIISYVPSIAALWLLFVLTVVWRQISHISCSHPNRIIKANQSTWSSFHAPRS